MSSEVRIHQANQILNKLVEVGEHLDNILEGFQIYDSYKGILDPEIYESSLAMYQQALIAMNEQMENYYILMNELSETLN